MKAAGMIVAFVAVALAGCSAGSGLTTGALLGEDKPAAPVNDGPSRAFQVGTASARAVKCGFNFDPAKLKTNYIAYEKQQPGGRTSPRSSAFTTFHSTALPRRSPPRATTARDGKTRQIKADLTRHLAGDYTPNPPKPAEEDGLFSGWGNGGSDSEGMKIKHPMDNSD